MINKCQNGHVSVCFKFSQLCFCQILFEVVYSWESYHQNKKGELSTETQCSLSVSADDVSIHLLYRTVLDVHCKQVASRLHVDVHTWLLFIDIDHHCQFQSSPQMNCLHIHTMTNSLDEFTITGKQYNTWNTN